MELLKKHRSPDVIFAGSSNLVNWVAIVSSELFADGLHAGIVGQNLQCTQSPMHLPESSATSGSSWMQSSIKFESRN